MISGNRGDDRPPTIDRLRVDIDGGTTGEKVKFPDPAIAPLGTDDEAAGRPVTRSQMAIEQQARPAPRHVGRREPGALVFYGIAVTLLALALLSISYFAGYLRH
jgi:hypothetical protein